MDKLDELFQSVNNAFAYAFSIGTLSTTGGEEIEVKINSGHVSAFMRV